MRIRASVPAILMVVFAACAGQAPETAPGQVGGTEPSTTSTSTLASSSRSGSLRGFSLSPRGSSPEDFAEFLDLAATGGSLLEWVGDAAEWGSDTGAPDIVVGLADSIGVEPITIGGWARTEDGAPLRPLTDEQAAAYAAAAASFASRHRPTYMGFGVEVNTIWREHPESWEASTALFAVVARAIHEASPDTRVLVVFQLERLRGRNGGLFGGSDDEGQATWDLVDDFPDADIIGFTTYPGLVFEDPNDIPDDYYRSVAARIDRPIAFTEMGWQAGGDLGPFSGTPARQAAFVERFGALTEGIPLEFVTWSFLFDPAVPPPFDTTGLVGADGTPRPGWDAWLAIG